MLSGKALTRVVTTDFTEQQKIADCLASLDELITAENKKLEVLKMYEKGITQKLFPQDGSGREGINFKKIAGISFAFPSEAEQVAIANFFRNVDKLIAMQAEKIEILKLHKKGLVQGLFSSVQEVIE